MAQFSLGPEHFTVTPEPYVLRIGQRRTAQLEEDFMNLLTLERNRDAGLLKCTDADWAELVQLATEIALELGCRRLYQSCGIYLEVR